MSNPSRSTLFIGDLSIFCEDADIHRAFSPYGQIVEIKIMRSEETNRNLSYGFIKFATEASSKAAMEALNGTILSGRPMRIRPATYKNKLASKESKMDGYDNSPVHVSFISYQTTNLVTEGSLRNIFSQYGEVIDVSIKKCHIENAGVPGSAGGKQSGYGFVYYPYSQAGIQGAVKAVEALQDTTVDDVNYKCSLAHNLLKSLSAPESAAADAAGSADALVSSIENMSVSISSTSNPSPPKRTGNPVDSPYRPPAAPATAPAHPANLAQLPSPRPPPPLPAPANHAHRGEYEYGYGPQPNQRAPPPPPPPHMRMMPTNVFEMPPPQQHFHAPPPHMHVQHHPYPPPNHHMPQHLPPPMHQAVPPSFAAYPDPHHLAHQHPPPPQFILSPPSPPFSYAPFPAPHHHHNNQPLNIDIPAAQPPMFTHPQGLVLSPVGGYRTFSSPSQTMRTTLFPISHAHAPHQMNPPPPHPVYGTYTPILHSPHPQPSPPLSTPSMDSVKEEHLSIYQYLLSPQPAVFYPASPMVPIPPPPLHPQFPNPSPTAPAGHYVYMQPAPEESPVEDAGFGGVVSSGQEETGEERGNMGMAEVKGTSPSQTSSTVPQQYLAPRGIAATLPRGPRVASKKTRQNLTELS